MLTDSNLQHTVTYSTQLLRTYSISCQLLYLDTCGFILPGLNLKQRCRELFEGP